MGNSDEQKGHFIYQEVKPTFLVGDLQVAAKFYCDVLGFEKKWAWGEPEVRVGVGPMDNLNGQDFEINLINDPKIGPSGTSFVYFHVKGIEAIHQRCLHHGANVYLELGDREWGMKDFRVSDPFGNRMGFGEVL